MSAHVLLNLLNELGKRDKMRDSIYHMALRLLYNLFSAEKTLYFCHYVRNVVMDVITFPVNL